jgi:hypothetical protein
MVWFKWVANAHRDAEISALTDTQFRAFITIIGEVKLLRSGGVFKNRQHLKTVIGARLFRGVEGLLKSGLLTESGTVSLPCRTILAIKSTPPRPLVDKSIEIKRGVG